MSEGSRIGVVAPHFDGEYYGRLLVSFHRLARQRRWQLFAIQAADEIVGTTTLEEPVAFHGMDAWLIILPSVSEHVLDRLEESGKPVVSVGFRSRLSRSRAVFVDNRQGMKEAVLHLAGHGHRRIAFVGRRGSYDLDQRYLGYRDALEASGIAYDERLVADASDHMIEGGMLATAGLLDVGAAFTAVAAGTDLNAIGAMECLLSRGYRIPGDVAVVGFDDIPQAGTMQPALTTVRQSLEDVADAAVRELQGLLDGDAGEGDAVPLPIEFVKRGSCGCASTAGAGELDVNSFAQALSGLRTAMHRITMNQNRVTRGLIKATRDEHIHISNLFWNMNHWGCLALWEPDEFGRRRLVVRQTFSQRDRDLPAVGSRFDVEQFPPLDRLPASAAPGGEDVVFLHPIRSDAYDWGYLALCGPVDSLRELAPTDWTRQSYSILAVALERELLFGQVRSMAEKLEIVSRTTSDGIWEWEIGTGKVEWHLGAHKVLSAAGSKVTDNLRGFVRLIHPDDRGGVLRAMSPPFEPDRPIQLEFRIRARDSRDIWLYAAAGVVRDAGGQPIRIIGSISDITEKKASESRILQLAYHDALTGLPNRLLFQERLQSALEYARDTGTRLAVLMIDLDRFKFINDTLGHQAGDRLLRQVTDRLRECVAGSDTIARLGGDEFIVLIPRIRDEEEARLTADRICRELDAPFCLESQELFVAASVGMSLYPDHGADADALIKFADMAMYRAKETGGNSAAVFTPSLSSQSAEIFNLEKGLRRAVERDEFKLEFQPQISLSTGKVYGAEVLLRWQPDETRLIQPAEFIPLAEETGLIIPIGQWVLEQACLECRRWLREGMPSLVISVNISAQQFGLKHFPDTVREVLRKTGIEAKHLCLEITEYTAVQDLDHSIAILKELVDIGVRIAIDDFGIGQSPLVLLKRFPVHAVKIDPSFVRNMNHDSDDEAIVKAVIEMAHGLGLAVVAEGVEEDEQLEKLQALKCDRIQGFFTGRPMTSDQFIAYFDEISNWVSSV